MSERRCNCTNIPFRVCDICQGVTRKSLSQDVASSEGDPGLTRSLRPSAGATSCDSKLAAIRERLARSDSSLWEAGAARTLLRMVDELTEQRDDYWHQYLELEGENVALLKERGELRAKLSAAHAWEKVQGDGWNAEIAHGRELQEKLVHMTLDLQNCADVGRKQEKRAEAAEAHAIELRKEIVKCNELTRHILDEKEAAEARVRTLADALFAATGGHVDLDNSRPR